MGMKYHRYDATSISLEILESWDSYAASAAIPRIMFISWKPPPPKFVKMSFDGSIRDAIDGIGYIIRDSDGMLLVAGAPFSLSL